jgi:hypothetical protein
MYVGSFHACDMSNAYEAEEMGLKEDIKNSKENNNQFLERDDRGFQHDLRE